MEIKDLTLSYEDKKVIEHLNLEINAKITCILGENGKGKSTLLKCIAGLLKEEKGCILDKPVNPSVCFQEDRLFETFTVLENIKAVTEDEEKIKEVLRICGLTDLQDRKCRELSGGEKRRVAIARALAYKGDYLLLDEPLKGIDKKNAAEILQAIRNSEIPVLMITHSQKEAEFLEAEIIHIQ